MHNELIAALSGTGVLDDVGKSLRAAFYMFWDTLWALVAGFGLSGAVQAFASRQKVLARLGNHRPAAIGRASIYGALSSSCSYAASATAKSLFARGADFVAAMVFMLASTNLVIELGIVLVVLIGWQFLAAQVVGGIIMIVLLVVLAGLGFRGAALARAGRIAGRGAPAGHDHAGHDHAADDRARAGEAPADSARPSAKTLAGWSDAAAYTMSDLSMLRREMAVGFVAAGILSVLVPGHLWRDLFLQGHGAWTTLENAAVGPLVAVISFVCSIGNVPLAAALWRGGISFGGVVSFIFADLITLPLLLIYRKQYGTAMMWRILWVFWVAMSLAGLATEELFRAAGLIPGSRPALTVADSLGWNYTTVLDIVFLGVFAAMYSLYRMRGRLGGGEALATDPVCGMQVNRLEAAAFSDHRGQRHYFCSEHCRERFSAQPVHPAPPA